MLESASLWLCLAGILAVFGLIFIGAYIGYEQVEQLKRDRPDLYD